MSLINQMLSDLETRRGGSQAGGSEALDGLRPAAPPTPAHRPVRTLIAISLAVIAAVSAWHLRGAIDGPRTNGAESADEARGPGRPETASAPDRIADVSAQGPDRSDGPGRDTDPGAGVAERDHPVMDDDGALHPTAFDAVVELIEADAGPDIGRPAGREEYSAVRGTAAAETPPTEPAAVTVVDDLPDITVPDPTPDTAGGEPEREQPLVVDIDELEIVPERPGTFQKTELVTASGMDRERRLEHALALLASGRSNHGIESLRALVADEPDFVAGRRQLARELIKHGATAESIRVLEAGLEQTPDEWRYAWLLAHVLIDQNDAAGALETLRSAAPPIEADLEYHAFIAALAQQQGQHHQASETYRRILTHDARQGVWWIGLAISLSAAGQRDAALEAYARAAGDGSLSENLREYAHREIARLRSARS